MANISQLVKDNFMSQLTNSYLKEAGKISFIDAFNALTNGEKNKIQKSFELGTYNEVGRYIQNARIKLAKQQAEDRINEMLADDSLSMAELEELLS